MGLLNFLKRTAASVITPIAGRVKLFFDSADSLLKSKDSADTITTYASQVYASALVADAINNGTTGIAPSQNAVYDALALKFDTPGAWVTSFTPTVSSGAGILSSASATCRYQKIGRTCIGSIIITITTNGTGSGDIRCTIPFAEAGIHFSGGRAYGSSSKELQGIITGSLLQIFNYDGTYPGATGEVMVMSFAYEAAS